MDLVPIMQTYFMLNTLVPSQGLKADLLGLVPLQPLRLPLPILVQNKCLLTKIVGVIRIRANR